MIAEMITLPACSAICRVCQVFFNDFQTKVTSDQIEEKWLRNAGKSERRNNTNANIKRMKLSENKIHLFIQAVLPWL